jgi:hypothetical protein
MSNIERAFEELADEAIDNYNFDDIIEKYLEDNDIENPANLIKDEIEDYDFSPMFEEQKYALLAEVRDTIKESDFNISVIRDLKYDLKSYIKKWTTEEVNYQAQQLMNKMGEDFQTLAKRKRWLFIGKLAGIACLVTGFFELVKWLVM